MDSELGEKDGRKKRRGRDRRGAREARVESSVLSLAEREVIFSLGGSEEKCELD